MRFSGTKGILAKPLRDAQLPVTRHSSGFEQFCTMLRNSENLSILDMSGASQANVSFVTGYGHRISSDDAIGTMQQCFGADFFTNQQAASNAHRFLEQTLTFPDNTFDGALVWDTLQFLVSPLLDDTVAKLLRVMQPGALILGFFNADEKTNAGADLQLSYSGFENVTADRARRSAALSILQQSHVGEALRKNDLVEVFPYPRRTARSHHSALSPLQ